MKVKVLEGYNDKNLGALKKGDVVEMTEDRYNYLSDKNANPYKVVLVEKVEELVYLELLLYLVNPALNLVQ